MTDRYEDVINQMDGYTVSSTLLSQTKVQMHHSESKMVKILTTIYRDKPPRVEYMIIVNSGLETHTTSSLEQAIALYLGGK